jgi:hypothetical protein
MRRSTFCIQAEKNARPRDLMQKKLIDLLNEPIRSDELKRLRKRADALARLFNNSSSQQAISLLERLNDHNDALGRLFKCELETSFRNTLLNILRIRSQERSPTTADRPPPSPPPEPPPEEPPPEEPPPEEPPPEEPPPEEPPPEEPPPEELRPEPLGFPIITDILTYIKDLLRWVNELKKRTSDRGLLEKIERLQDLLEDTLKLLSTGIVAGAIVYFVFDILTGKLIEFREITHLGERRIISGFRSSNEFIQLEETLKEISQLADEIEHDQILGELDEPIRVEPKVRGFAVEDFHLNKLFTTQGFEKLPDRWPGLDAVRGDPIRRKGIKIYRNAEGISAKSTNITDGKRLLSRLRTEWLPPLKGGKYLVQLERVKIESLRSIAIHLIFEEGISENITEDTIKALKLISKEAKPIKFQWFVFSQGNEVDGPTFFRNLQLKEK